jgi:hypothetical protein
LSTQRTLSLLRTLLLGLVLFGAAGLGAELVLLEHWGAAAQRLPLLLLLLTGGTALAALVRPGPLVLRAFRWVMALAVVSGVVGAGLHLRSNLQLELELSPDRPMGRIVWSALRGGTPTLAPGAMIQLGLLGLLAVYRHPGRTSGDGSRL